MNYNKIFLFLIVLTTMLITLGIIHADNYSNGEFAYLAEFSNPTFLPAILNAGDLVSVSIDIHNKGSIVTMENLTATLNLGQQFDIDDLNQNIDLILPDDTKTAVFNFKVNENTISGYYPAQLILKYYRSGELITEKTAITIPISNTQKRLEVSINPNVINPGNKTDMIFSIKNLSGIEVSNISLEWSESTNLILPLGSDNKKYISSIKPNETTNSSTTIASDPNIAPGIYLLDINISYTGPNGTQTQESKIGLIVGGETDFEISAELQSSGLALSIANIGSNNAGAVVVKVPKQPGININGTNTAILGNIDIGDFTLANFNLRTNNLNTTTQTNPQNVSGTKMNNTDVNFFKDQNIINSLKLEINYTDTTGKRQIITKTIALNNLNTQTTAITIKTTNSYWIPLLILIIIFGLSAIYNKMKANKEWKTLGIYSAIIIVLYLIGIFVFSSSTTSTIIITIIAIILIYFALFKSNKKK